ncbi:hypothetical protein CEXT_35821 [Caerostris extrusa]|uniref:Uncharacterized protein n=1 Tax=Caerostris extrusa TaxID=172846 RepID=A0AAV4SYY1_CAEEX|nr:hypothetical protein CEXT_35821 [Caerostris extrusa]
MDVQKFPRRHLICSGRMILIKGRPRAKRPIKRTTGMWVEKSYRRILTIARKNGFAETNHSLGDISRVVRISFDLVLQ